jgi:organic radical activating enzyme
MVSLISDRFLGTKFAKEVLFKKYSNTRNRFTYVLIADTIGCNLNCWFCYAWKYLDIKDAKRIDTHFVSAKGLAKQFDCKIRKTADLKYLKNQVYKKNAFEIKEQGNILKHFDLELPFSRIRISGGEPLYSNVSVFQAEDRGEDLVTQTIKYWIEFFEELDRLIGKIKTEGIINIATTDSNWQGLHHPVWLTESKDRIMIRFDTNGIIFGNEKHAELFYSELYRLFKEGKLNNVCIQIDYSFKGVTSKEFMWSQRKCLPTTNENNDNDVDINNNPQIKGYKNIISNIDKFVKINSSFKNCVSVTVERGIDHDWEKSKLYLYYPNALKWKRLENTLGVEFSDVINCFDLNFGWNFNAKVYRYTNRGALIKLTNGNQSIDSASVSIKDLMNFRKQNLDSKDYMTLVYPVDTKISIKRTTTIPTTTKPKTILRKKTEGSQFDNYAWIITGSEDNLRLGIKNGLWGVVNDAEDLWMGVKENDPVFFYCTRPVSGIVGWGVVIDTHVDKKPFWSNENPNQESKYPLRIKFVVMQEVSNWSEERKSLEGMGIDYFHGLNSIDTNKTSLLLKKLNIKNN